jgi:hypothetical protein
LKKGDFVFPADGARADESFESSTPAEDDFRPSQTSPADIVTIIWNGRKCGRGK